jgi:hypothetical protein
MSRWQGTHALTPLPLTLLDFFLKSWIFSIEACIQITFILISFNFFGPPSKLVPHFLVQSYSSAIPMHV